MFPSRNPWPTLLALLASLGTLIPGGALNAQSSRATPAHSEPSDRSGRSERLPAVRDVALSEGGTLTGQVVDDHGAPLDGAVVVLHQGGTERGRTVANDEGFFSFTGLRGGTYEIESAGSRTAHRLWAEGTAPPQAIAGVLHVGANDPVVRGQMYGPDIVTSVMLVASVGSLVVSSIALAKISDIEDDVDDLLASP